MKKGTTAYQLQTSIDDYIKFPVITTVETLIYFLNERKFHKKEGIFGVPGNKNEIDELLDKLKKNPVYQIPNGTQLASVIFAIKQLFSELDPPLFNSVKEEYLKITTLKKEENKLKQLEAVVKDLTEKNKKLLKLLLEFLNKVLKNKGVKQMLILEFANIFELSMIDIPIQDLDPLQVKKLEMALKLKATFKFLLKKRVDVLKWL